ncbi:MAG: trypsin-like peptidase domain-containing protein [Nanoarchaeota archaeon]|nr:trypsin-like peptidase domain-containing protein [Patescibacteria group bacterium]MCG2720270.1 trypsin-like peptidase domain-containing protein [Nanoarchaeota archaeon]
MKQKKFIFKSWSSSLIIIALISLIIGALAGTISGFYASSLLTNTEGSFLYPLLQQKILHQFQDKTTDTTKDLSTSILNKEQTVIEVVEKVNPSVVSIVVTKYVTQYYGLQEFPFDDFFNSPFFEFHGPSIPTPVPNEEKQKQEVGGGTGFVISSEKGLILTNKHVVSDEEAEYTIVTNDGEKYEAEVLARDPFNDIAVLKVATDNLPAIQLGDSDQLKIGETVIAIGNALGEYRNTVTKGVISGISRRVVASGAGYSEVLEGVIQTDAAINFGNSGGPLINLQGEVIGINTAISRQGQLIGFAIPSNQAKQVVESVEKYGKIVRPFLGIRYLIINQEMANVNKLPFDYGALIVRGQTITDLAVIPGSPANKAGLVENDIILEINNEKITEIKSLAKEIQKYQPGEEIELKIYHQGEEKIIKVVLEEYKE